MYVISLKECLCFTSNILSNLLPIMHTKKTKYRLLTDLLNGNQDFSIWGYQPHPWWWGTSHILMGGGAFLKANLCPKKVKMFNTITYLKHWKYKFYYLMTIVNQPPSLKVKDRLRKKSIRNTWNLNKTYNK